MYDQKTINDAKDKLVDYFTQVDRTTLRDVQQGSSTKEALYQSARKYLLSEIKLRDEEAIKAVLVAFNKYVFGYN